MSSRSVTVFGSSKPRPGSGPYEEARRLGRLLAGAGFTVVNGGYSGTMEAVSRGATEVGGRAVGITCAVFDGRRVGGNQYLSETVHTPDLLARLRQLTDRSCAFIVLEGGVGTLLELFLVWNLLATNAMSKPVLLVGDSWQQLLAMLEQGTAIEAQHTELLRLVESVEGAVALLQSSGLPAK